MDRRDIVRLATKLAMRLIELKQLEFCPESGGFKEDDLIDIKTMESVL